MKHFSKEDISKVISPKVREVEVEGYLFLLKSLTAYEVTKIQLGNQQGKPTEEQLFYLLSQSIVDDNNELIFTVEEAKNLDPVIYNSLLIEIYDLNKLNPNAVEKAREELKNLKDSSTSN